jgi:hypothetical protein
MIILYRSAIGIRNTFLEETKMFSVMVRWMTPVCHATNAGSPVIVMKVPADKVIASITVGTEFYLNMNNPYEGGSNTSRPTAQFNISYGKGSQLPFTTETAPNGLKYFTTTGNPINYASGSKPGRSVRLDVYPDGGKWANKTSHSWPWIFIY